jgi:tight adherence protein B
MLILFVVLLVVSFTIIMLLTRTKPSEKATRERLDTLVRREAQDATETVALQKPARAGLSERLSERFRNYGFAKNLETLILYSGAKTTVGSVLLTSAALAVGAAVAVHSLIASLPLTMIAGAVGGAARYFLLRFKKSRRLKKFNEALPDAIELMARALRAGHSMASSIEVISQQSPEPLAGEFGTCFQQQKFGIPFRDALLNVGERIPSNDLHFLITAILVQKETGGDLTDILDRTTAVIRDRVRIEGEVRTYTAQGRLTGWILSLLPVAMLAGISVIVPSYSHMLFYDPLGQKLLYLAGGMIVIGSLIIRKIVDIKV